jgi:hypothetical protein
MGISMKPIKSKPLVGKKKSNKLGQSARPGQMAQKVGNKGSSCKSNNSASNKRQREQIEQDKILRVVDQAFQA